ncbi:MAG: hypothetical protein LBG79_01840 [Spirochaetaceae bacterium]|jgi:hypothetical protein|nr:hypothetical protein [Spirochaetaceae bacterium]GMO26471.1 MAG: hypothetical protein Pg6A_13780 [Termitinemataceae bacterium]
MSQLSAQILAQASFSAKANMNNRTTLPVPPASYIYAHFKHVSGTPAPEGVSGVAVAKLKLLDSIIERISQQGLPKTKKEIPYKKKEEAPAGALLDIAA